MLRNETLLPAYRQGFSLITRIRQILFLFHAQNQVLASRRFSAVAVKRNGSPSTRRHASLRYIQKSRKFLLLFSFPALGQRRANA